MLPDFQRALLLVIAVGSAIGLVGAGILLVAFRGFGRRTAGGESHMAVIAALVLFVFAACAALFWLAYR